MRYAAKVDDNHKQIVSALRAVGAWVWSTAPLGNGFPDLLVFFRDKYTLLEVKRPGPPSASKLTAAEEKFRRGCPGPLYVVRTPEEALEAIGAAKPRLTPAEQAVVDRYAADLRSRRAGGQK